MTQDHKQKLWEYVTTYTVRGACRCGLCIDAPENPEETQPEGHTSDLQFFKVAKNEGADAGKLKSLVENVIPVLFDGEEHNYMEVGVEMGDQGVGLMLMGLGELLGLWEVLSPNKLMPDLPDETKQQMAGMGMVTCRAVRKKEEE